MCHAPSEVQRVYQLNSMTIQLKLLLLVFQLITRDSLLE